MTCLPSNTTAVFLTFTAVEYTAGVRDLRTRELELFAAVRQHQFKDIAESNYWHRGRLKFTGGIEMEWKSLSEAGMATPPR